MAVRHGLGGKKITGKTALAVTEKSPTAFWTVKNELGESPNPFWTVKNDFGESPRAF